MRKSMTEYPIDEYYSVVIYRTGHIKIISYRRRKEGKPLKPYLSRAGRYTVMINKRKTNIHSLVAFVILGPRPDGYEVNHIDGDKLNNHPSNLEYITGKENLKHGWDNGLFKGPRITKEEADKRRNARSKQWKLNNRDRVNARQRAYYHMRKAKGGTGK